MAEVHTKSEVSLREELGRARESMAEMQGKMERLEVDPNREAKLRR